MIIDISDLLPIWKAVNFRCISCKKKWVSVQMKGFVVRKCLYCKSKKIIYYEINMI